MTDYRLVQQGDMSAIEGEDLKEDLVRDIEHGGIADVMAIPNSPEDLDKELSRMVLYFTLTTEAGTTHSYILREDAVHVMFDMVHQYREEMLKKEGAPNDLVSLLRKLIENIEDES